MKIKMEAMILARRLRLSRNHIILDLGCGIGLYNVFGVEWFESKYLQIYQRLC
jgi:tRNA1(Val) A37 N6-methylase TrmN6